MARAPPEPRWAAPLSSLGSSVTVEVETADVCVKVVSSPSLLVAVVVRVVSMVVSVALSVAVVVPVSLTVSLTVSVPEAEVTVTVVSVSEPVVLSVGKPLMEVGISGIERV